MDPVSDEAIERKFVDCRKILCYDILYKLCKAKTGQVSDGCKHDAV